MENPLTSLNKKYYLLKYLKLNLLKKKLLISNNSHINNNQNQRSLIKWDLKFLVWPQNLKQKMKSYLLHKLKKKQLYIKIVKLNNSNNNNQYEKRYQV